MFAAVAAEALIAWRLRRRLYEWRDSELRLGLAAGWAVGSAATGVLATLAIAFGYSHRVLDLGTLVAAPILVILLGDLLYYAWRRLSHRWRWLWASHFPHHTAKRLNMLASMRQGWTDVISGAWLSRIGLGFLGFSPIQTAPYFGLLIVWNRLFGTFAAEGPAVIHDFGMAGFDSDASNPVEIATREWRGMLTEFRSPAKETLP